MKAKLTQQKRKTSKSTSTAGELNISFSVTDRTTKYKIKKYIEALNNTINQ